MEKIELSEEEKEMYQKRSSRNPEITIEEWLKIR